MSSLLEGVEWYYPSTKGSLYLSTPSIDIKSEVEWANRSVTPWSTRAEFNTDSLDDLYTAFCSGDKKSAVLEVRIEALSTSTSESSFLDLLLELVLKSSGSSS